MSKGGNTVPSITNAEHIGPTDTGDNIEAKRVANYVWNDSTLEWDRQSSSSAGVAAYSDNVGTDKKGLVDADRHVQTDVLSSALPTGAATAANQSTVIGHLDGVEGLLTTIDADTGNISTKIDTVAGAVSGTEMQVDIVSAPTLTVDLGVNNDVTVTSGAITEANSAAIKTAVETIDNAISGSEMQVDVVGALPAGTNAIGKLAANSGVDIGDVDVTSAVSSSFATGSNLDIDTSAEQLVASSVACKFGVTVKAAATNTGTVYIGASSSVTAGTTGSTDGFPLEPGESVTVPVNNVNLLYGIASVANQKVFLMGV